MKKIKLKFHSLAYTMMKWNLVRFVKDFSFFIATVLRKMDADILKANLIYDDLLDCL